MAVSATRADRLSSAIKGFTLIELLVAISILAIVALLGWRGLDGIIRARVALNAELEQTRGMQLTFAQMQSDCLQLASARVLGNRPPLFVQNDRLVLARTVFVDNQPTRLEVVDYHLRDGILTRWESPQTRNLTEFDGLWKSTLSNDGDDTQASQAVLLQSHLNSMHMRLWASGANGWSNIGDNVDATPLAKNVPRWSGLEVSLQVAQQTAGSVIKVFLLGGT